MNIIRFKKWLTEATSGSSKFDKYFKGRTIETTLLTDTYAYDPENIKKLNVILKKGTKVTVQSDSTINSEYNSKPIIKVMDGDDEIFYRVSLSVLDKPIAKKVHSKELTPDNLNLAGKVYTLNQLKDSTILSINNTDVSEDIKNFLKDCVVSAAGQKYKINEAQVERYSDKIFISQKHTSGDIYEFLNIISKNFGEVLSALYITKKNKKIKTIEFPSLANEGLYDFIGNEVQNKIKYSVKSSGGSSTAMKNLHIFLSNVDKKKLMFSNVKLEDKELETEIKSNGSKYFEIIKSLSTANSTPEAIINYIINHSPNMKKAIENSLSIRFNSYEEFSKNINQWRSEVNNSNIKNKKKQLVNLFDKLGKNDNNTLSNIESLIDIKPDKTNHGYLLYPLGSYIISNLNKDKTALAVLNMIISESSVGNTIQQITVDVFIDRMEFKVIKFKNNNFMFSYNGTVKNAKNRPLGFKER